MAAVIVTFPSAHRSVIVPPSTMMFVCEIASDERGVLGTEFVAQLLAASDITTVQDDARTFRDESPCHGSSDAGGAAGDEDGLILQTHGAVMCGHGQATACCFDSPSPSMPSSTTSPGLRKTGVGFKPRPTPGGVPVLMTSPGSRVMNWLM